MYKRPHFLKLSLLTLGIFFYLNGIGQNVLLEGVILSKEETPLNGATIEYAEGKGVSTDAQGVFKVELAYQPEYTLKIRSLGYVELDTTIQMERGKNYLIIKLEEKTYSQPEVVVTERVNTIFKRREWQIQDFKIHKDRIYVLYWLNNQKYLALSNLKGIELDEMALENKYTALYESCSERLYLKGKSGLVEIDEQNGRLVQVGEPISLEDFNKFMMPCVNKLDKEYVFKRYKDHNKRLHYFRYDEERKAQLIYEIFDEQSYQTARSYYYEILSLYNRAVANPEENAIDAGVERRNIIASGEWKGDLMDLILNNDLVFAVSYYQNIESRAIDSYEFKLGDHLYILDKLKREVIRYNGATKKLQKLKIDTAIDWKGLNEILVDEKSSSVYLSVGNKDLYQLEIGNKRIQVVKVKALEEDWRTKKQVQIHDGMLYCYFQPTITKFQTVVKKESLREDDQ